ncbi:EcsC family protein [Domibacillus sp. A3M-37]|uniref:EcsC family protein n=1 Tax=Domibacillus TaxID=1433999 RepID=UPI0006183045|nr:MULTISPECIES: EcsC family protein [Domibacillus]MCP3761576.1 EcsC family protein [Domibacillus sp. A3M-37]
METKETLMEHLQKIEQWENDQKGLWIWDRAARLPFAILDKMTPSFIQRKIGSLLDELGYYLQSGGKYLTKQSSILKKLERHAETPVHTIDDVKKLPLSAMDQTALSIQKSHAGAATVQGATTGIGGIFTLAADIPATLALSLKTLQEIAVAYGYDPNEREERVFVIKCLQFSSSDIVGKRAILKEISDYANRGNSKEMISQMQGWREVVLSYREQYSLKKVFRLIPVVGIIFGAISNRSMIEDLSDTAMMLYRKRRILERLAQQTNETESDIRI